MNMPDKHCLLIFTILLIFIFPSTFFAEISSTNYRIDTAVMSGGGASMGSANFQMNGTVGQPSPLMDPLEPPYSVHYDLYPGYWYTLISVIPELCDGDFNADGDVDGSDLAVFAADFGRTDCAGGPLCEGDFNGDGDVDGSDLAIFAKDFGRADCP